MKPHDLVGAHEGKETRGISRSLLMLVAAAALPLLLFGVIVAALMVDQKRTAVADDLAHVVRALRIAVDRELLGQFEAIDMLASDPSVDGADFSAFRQRARRALDARPEWRNVVLVDPATRRIAASVLALPAAAPLSVAPEEVDQVAQRRKPVLAAIVPRGQMTSTPFLLLLAPVVRNGQVAVVLGVAIDPKRMSDLFAEQQLSALWTGAVLDGGKRIAGRSRDPERFLGVAATPSLAQRIGLAEGGMFSALNQEGQTVHTVFSRSAATGWTVVIGVPTAEVEAPIRRFLIELSLLGGALLIFGLTLTYAVAGAIIRRSDAYERSMHDSQSRLQALLREHNDLLERIPIGVYKYRMQKDGSDRFDFVSARMCQQLGVSADEIYRDAAMAFKCADEQELADLIRVNDEARATLQPFAWEGRMLGPQGKLWVRMESVPTSLPNGDVLWNGIQYDITARKQAELKLQESEAKFRSVFENSMDATLLTTTDGGIIAANPAAQKMLGYSEHELRGLGRASVVNGSDPRLAAALEERGRNGKFRGELTFIDKHGRRFPVEISTAVFADHDGVQLTSMSARDISERKRAEQRVIESEMRLQTIIQLEPECIKIIDADGRLRDMNPAGLAMIEADSLEQVVGQPVVNLVTPPYRDAFLDLHRRVIGGQGGRLEFEVIGLRGGRRWLETNAVPMHDHGVTMHLGVTRDVTERRKMEEQVRQMAFHDELTQLPNRRLLLDRLRHAMSASKRSGKYGAVMFLDLDNFKPLNDAHGHEAGDLLLIEVARRLTECVRESDTVARFGGDEFVLVLNDLSADEAEAREVANTVAEKVRSCLAEPYRLPLPQDAGATIEHHCAASIGVVLFLNQDSKLDDILKWADATMYRAKEAGRNRIEFFGD